jgi:hypothetical protein
MENSNAGDTATDRQENESKSAGAADLATDCGWLGNAQWRNARRSGNTVAPA